MSVCDEPPRRLKEQSDQANVFERLAGQAARDMPRAKPLSPTALARIAASVDQRSPAVATHRRHVWVVVAAAFVLGVVTTASAQRADVLRQWFTRVVTPAPPTPRPAPRPAAKDRIPHVAPSAPTLDQPVQNEAMPESPPAEATPQPMAPTQRRTPEIPAVPSSRERTPNAWQLGPPATRKVALADPADAPRPSSPIATPPVASEQPGLPPLTAAPTVAPKPEPAAAVPVLPAGATPGKGPAAASPHVTDRLANATPSGAPQATLYLTQAVRVLRVERSPKGALQLLDRHADELEQNGFAHEALLLRVEAMLALGRQAEVLRLLDATSLTDVTAARALLVMRGELRAAANRCGDALGDFALVLVQSRQPPKAALVGRARCRQQLGDHAGAQADVERYRAEYPGDHALDDLASPRR